jgi:hypothetical protein
MQGSLLHFSGCFFIWSNGNDSQWQDILRNYLHYMNSSEDLEFVKCLKTTYISVIILF